MTDNDLKDLVASLAEKHDRIASEHMEIANEQKETGKQLRETMRGLDELKKMVGGISESNGAMAERYFTTALKNKMEIGGLKFEDMLISYYRKKKSKSK